METIINDTQNCSTYNPCSSNGYCVDNANGTWSCQCKFWGSGTLCDQQTNSGKQIIALGCILGACLMIFYGVNLFHYIRDKRNQSKQDEKKKSESKDSKVFELVISNIKRSVRVRRCIISLLTPILAALTLVIKWLILKPIHDTIIYEYKNNLPLYYVPHSICRIMSMTKFNVLTFPVACFIIIVCIVVTKRTSLLRNKCHGYVGPPMPADFFSHIDRKFAAVIFAICADELFGIVRSFFNGSSSFYSEGIILQYLERIFEVLIIGLRYYPLLATVYLDRILALAFGTIYAWLDYSITIINQAMCTSDYYITFDEYNTTNNGSSLIEKLEYYGTGSQLLVLQLCTDIPRFLCLAYVSIKLPVLLIGKIYQRLKKNSLSQEEQMMVRLTREERVLLRASQPNSPEMLYVRNLLRSADRRPRTRHLFGRLIPKFIYEWRDDFYFSTRVLCVYSSIILLLFFITVQACVQILPTLYSIQKILQEFFNFLSFVGDNNENDIDLTAENKPQQSQFPVPNLERPYSLAVATTVLITIIQLLILLANIRRNLFQSFRGDDSEIPRRKRSKYVSYATGNMHFAGYFIGYFIWGFILIAVFTSLLWICIEGLIIYRNARLLESILKAIIPSLLLIYFKTYLNQILAQYVFLQHFGRVLAINNRRIFMIFIYFNFFLDAFLGFISSIIRLIKTVIAGTFYMCRLDYSPLGRKLELFDGGFSAYCGFIHSECVHRHPVMLVFASHIFRQCIMKRFPYGRTPIDVTNHERTPFMMMLNDQRNKSLRAIRKWHLGLFLARNPMIAFFRKAYLNRLHIDNVRALNDLDSDDLKKNMNNRISVYAHHRSVTRADVVSPTGVKYLDSIRF